MGQLGDGVELQSPDDAESVAQRIGQHPRTRGCADQGEGFEVEFDGARSGTFANHDVDLVVFKRGIENFFHHGREAVNFVDK